MPVPNTFGTATSAIPLSQLDANFATPITIGNTAVQLGNTVTTLNNMTLANVTISSGTITITNVAVTTANVSGTANISTLVVVGNETVGGNTTITGNITAANANVTTNLVLSNGTANGVAYLNGSKVLTTGSALTFDGSNLSVVGTYAINQTNLFEINNGQSGATKFASGVSLTSDSGGNYTSAFYVASGSNTRYNLITGTPTDLLFYSANTEAMRLTGTSLYTASTINVGIGTSLPLKPLDVSFVSGARRFLVSYDDSVITIKGAGSTNAPEALRIIGDNIRFNTGTTGSGTEAARIDSSGQLKLQTGALQVFGALDAGQISAAVMDWQPATNNARFLSYGPSGTSGGFSWTTVIGGGAGTQAMTLDASGNLGIVTTSPASFFSSADNLVVGTTTGSNGVTILGGSTATAVLAFGYTTGTSAGDASNRAKIWYDGTSDTLRMSSGGSLMNATQFVLDASGNLLVGKTAVNGSDGGFVLSVGSGTDQSFLATNIRGDAGGEVVVVNRQGSDGTLIQFRQANTEEGTISVSGTTVSYNGGHLSRWAQTTAPKDDTLVKGTVLSNLDAMNVYTDADGVPVANEQLNKVKISDTEGDVNVAGVFVNWTHDEAHNVDEINMAMTGDMIIRIAQGVTVARGDLLMSAGDGTAKPQADDIVRSKTVAKVTSTHVTCTYADGSYCVPCVLMAC